MFSSHRNAFIGFSAASMIALGAIAIPNCRRGSTQTSAKCPTAYVANDTVDLGVVRPYETREIAFLIENKGLHRLILNELGCGCGSPIRPAIVVPPGQIEDILVSLYTGMDSGKIEKRVSFATNDTLRPRVDLTVVAKVNGL